MSTEIEMRGTGGAIVTHDYTEYDGQGYENQTQADRSIPFLALAQDTSPQTKKNKSEFIEGLEVGQLFNSVTGEVYGDNVLFIPGITEHCFTLWVPRDQGGGFRGRVEINDPIIAEAKSAAARANRKMNELMTEDGLQLVETFYVWGAVLIQGESEADTRLEPMVIAFTSTKIGIYKKWQTRIGQFQVFNPKTNRKITPPLYAHLTQISSFDDENSRNQSFKNYVVGPAVNDDVAESLLAPNDPRFQIGKKIRDMVVSGMAKAAYESQEGGSAQGASSDGDSDGQVPF